jgi:16S rRNA (uracil1498-N3)-methyltransferase
MRRIHCEISMSGWGIGEVVELPAAASHYASRVLRLQIGAPVELFNASGEGWLGEIASDGDAIHIRLWEELDGDPAQAQSLPVVLVMAHPRGKKLDLVLQKATELGVAAIWIVPTERAVPRPDGGRLEGRLERWARIAAEAARQCGRRRPPEVCAPTSLEAALKELPAWATSRWACAVDTEQKTLTVRLQDSQRASGAALAVGPEGGFTSAELSMLGEHGFELASLGPRVLRAETAPLVGLALIQSLWGDLR